MWCVFDNKIWIIAGAKQGIGDTNEVWFSDDGKAWQQIESPPITPTHATTLFVYNNRLIIGAGHHMNQEVWALNIKE